MPAQKLLLTLVFAVLILSAAPFPPAAAGPETAAPAALPVLAPGGPPLPADDALSSAQSSVFICPWVTLYCGGRPFHLDGWVFTEPPASPRECQWWGWYDPLQQEQIWLGWVDALGQWQLSVASQDTYLGSQGSWPQGRFVSVSPEPTTCGYYTSVGNAPYGYFQFSASTYTFREDNSAAAALIERVGGNVGYVSVEVQAQDGTATWPWDYQHYSETIFFNSEQVQKSFALWPGHGDEEEGAETYYLNLRVTGGGAPLGRPSRAKIVLVDTPDLFLDEFTLDPASVQYSAGRYVMPVDVTVRYVVGEEPVSNVAVKFSDNGGWSETQTVAQIAPEDSAVLHLDWDVTAILAAKDGRADVQLTVDVNPDYTISEATHENNRHTAQVLVDARPRITELQTGYRLAPFLAGVALDNNFDVWVDWNGDLEGTGSVGEPKEALYTLNGALSTETVTDPAAAPAASHSYDMGADLHPGSNLLLLQATNAADFTSDPLSLQLDQAANAAWLVGLAVEVEGDPPEAPYDKIAVYSFEFEWPDEGLQGFFDVPASRVRFLRSSFGPSLGSWTLGGEYRTDGRGTVKGSGTMEGDVRGLKVLSAGGAVIVEAQGTVGLGQSRRLSLLELVAKVRAEGSLRTPSVPLTPYLPFVRVQGGLGAGVDATMGVEEQVDGSLDWKEPAVILGLDATAEGIASTGVEGIVYLAGGIGGTPRGEFNLPPEPSLLRSLSIDLFARVTAQALIWEKTWEKHFVYNVIGGKSLSGEPPLRVGGWQPIARVPGGLGQQAQGLPVLSFPYAAPDLARRADGALALVYVYDQPGRPDGQQLEIAAARGGGSGWTAPISLTDNPLLDLQPAVAYDAAGQAVAVWTELGTVVDDPANTDPQDLLGAMELAYAVYSPSLGGWTAPLTLTGNAQADFLPNLEADESGRLLALWLRDADNAYPLYPDEGIPLGSQVYWAGWDGHGWSTPTLAISDVNTRESPQFALAGGMGLLAWSQDADGDLLTISDTAIYTANWDGGSWTPGGVLAGAGDGLADRWPRLARDGAGRLHLVWVQRRVPVSAKPDDVVDRLYWVVYEGGSWSTPAPVVEDLNIVEPLLLVGPQDDLVVLWSARSASGMDLWYAVYDQAGASWSRPIQFTADAGLEWSYVGYVDGGNQLQVLFLDREVLSESVPISPTVLVGTRGLSDVVFPVLGASELEQEQRVLDLDLEMAGLEASAANPGPGETVWLTATLSNRGDFLAAPVEVAFYDGANPIGSLLVLPDLVAGETTTATVSWTVPLPAAAHSLRAVVDPADLIEERYEDNNEVSMGLLAPDLVVDWVHTTWGTSLWWGEVITVTAGVRNTGVLTTPGSFLVTLRADDPESGRPVLTTTVEAVLAPAEIVSVTFTLVDPVQAYSDEIGLESPLSGTHTGWIVADSGGEIAEAEEENNAGFFALDVLPDLALGAADVQGLGPLHVVVHNEGWLTATDVVVELRQGTLTGTLLYSGTIPAVAPDGEGELLAPLPPYHGPLLVWVDPANVIAEMDESNNLAWREYLRISYWVYLPLAR